MLTFNDFSKDLNINNPEEYVAILHAYEAFIDILWKDYGKRWTWCGGCHKTVRYDMATTKREPLGFNNKMKDITRCPECGCSWFIRDMEVTE